MILLNALSFLFGAALAFAIIGSALKTVVLPQGGSPRLSQAVFALVYRLLVHRRLRASRTQALEAMYGPVALVSLPLTWMVLMVIAFTFVFWGTGGIPWHKAFEISGSSLTTLGFSEPETTTRIWLAFVEATIGLGLVALLISYLPTIYGAYNGREKGIVRLRPITGIPPAPTEVLETLDRTKTLDNLDFWRSEADWILDMEQTHTAFPILTYFPETRLDHSWVASVGTLLDTATLVLSASETRPGEAFEEVERGALLLFVYGVPAFVRVARAAGVPVADPPRFADLTSHFGEAPPSISIGRDEYFNAREALAPILGVAAGHEEEAWRRFAHLRATYDLALRALAGLTQAPPAPWSTDRPASVGKPRFLRRRDLFVDWSATPVGERAPTGG